LQNSIHIEFEKLANEYIQQRLPEFIRIVSGDNGMNETGLSDLPIEVLHSLLLLIQQSILNQSTGTFIKSEDFENFLHLLRKGFKLINENY
jgi:hypothetical protein